MSFSKLAVVHFIRSFFALVLLLPIASRASDVAEVGGSKIAVPVPVGFQRYDGISKDADEKLASAVPHGTRLLRVFAKPVDVLELKTGMDAKLDRYFLLQSFIATEGGGYPLQDFAKMKKSLRVQFGGEPGVGPATKALANEVLQNMGGRVALLKIGENVNIGLYEETERSIDIGVLGKGQYPTGEPDVFVAASSAVFLKDRLFYLHVYSSFSGRADAEWTRAEMKAWREALLAANAE